MPRGIKLFRLALYRRGLRPVFAVACSRLVDFEFNAHWLMGFFFGVLHLAYGAYLYLTEKGKNAA